jgi:hypothetical protein
MIPDFPNFTKLTPADKNIYNRAVADYPPFSDILFSTLHIWWNQYEQLAVALLNRNVVIKYELPFDADNSGYCLVGKDNIDASIETIFEYLDKNGQSQLLVHVPEFAVEAISKRENYDIQEEPDYHEYILDSTELARLEGSSHGHIRTQINRFMREVEGKKLEHKPLDLSLVENQDHIFQAILEWEKSHPPRNDPNRNEHEALKQTLTNAAALDIESLALYIDDRLHGVILYHQPQSKDHYVIHHLRFDYTIPYASDYLTRQLAHKAVESNVPYINMEMDLGIENLRRHKTKLRPVKLFKKYRLQPALR